MIAFIFIVVALAIAGGVVLLVYFTEKKPPGFQPPPPGLSNSDLLFAVTDVWVDTYGMKYSDLPKLTWITGKQLNCFDGRGWKVGDECEAGMSWIERNESAIAWRAGTTKFSETAFAHELLHAAHWHNASLPSDHFSGAFIALVAKANARLQVGAL